MKKKTARSAKSTSPVRHASSRNATSLASEEMRSFLVHFILYLLVNFGLFIYLFGTSSDLNIFYLVAIGWGIGLVAHALAVFGVMKFLAKEW
jgi:glucan phosphoethanolaminetransferase (alkaline phosphatase superfamily)